MPGYFLESATYAIGEIKLVKILPQYKERDIGENFIPRIFCHIRYMDLHYVEGYVPGG